MLQCDNFNVNLKNLIGEALDNWRKTQLASCFKDTNNDFSRKATDISAPHFHGKQNWTFVEPYKQETIMVELFIHAQLTGVPPNPENEFLPTRIKKGQKQGFFVTLGHYC